MRDDATRVGLACASSSSAGAVLWCRSALRGAGGRRAPVLEWDGARSTADSAPARRLAATAVTTQPAKRHATDARGARRAAVLAASSPASAASTSAISANATFRSTSIEPETAAAAADLLQCDRSP